MASMSPRAVSLPTIDSIYPGRTASKKTASTNSPKAIVNEVDSTTLKEEVPDLAIVEEQLDRILDTLGMPSQLRTEIKTLPTDRKWQIVQLSKVTDQPTCLLKKVTSGITPQSFINTLSHPKAITPNLFTSLRVCVSNEPKSWTSEFLELDGLQILFNFIDKVIKKSTKKDIDWKILFEFLKTLKTFVGDKVALKDILQRGPFLNNLVHSAFGRYSPPMVPGKSSATPAVSFFSGTSTIPPLQNRKSTIELLIAIAMSSPTGWLVTVRSLEATTYVDINEEDGDRKLTPIKCDPKPWMGQDENMPNGFRTWLKEFEMVARERARTWNGSVRKANDIFNALADGTYRWQPIVQAVPCPVHEKTAVDYMMVNLCLIDTLYEHIPNRNAEERVNLRAHFNRFRLEQIYERLRLCPNLDLGRQLRHINDLNIADNAIISGTPPPTTTNTSSKEGCTSASPTIPASPEPDLPALPTEEPSTPTSSQTTWENASSSLSSSPTMSSPETRMPTAHARAPKGHSLRRQNAGRFEKVRVYDDNGEGVEEICHVESSTSLPPAAEASLASASTL